MAEDFTDIRIVQMDESLTTTPDPARSKTHDLHFTLSASAPAMWVEIANSHLANPWGTAGRKVRATTGHVIATTSTDDAQAVLDAVKPILDRVNQEYRQWLESEAQKRRQREEAETAEKERVKTLKDKLDFN